MWRDTIDISRREQVDQNQAPKSVRVVLGGFTVINPFSGDVDRLGVAITTKTEIYRKYQSYEATGKWSIIPRSRVEFFGVL